MPTSKNISKWCSSPTPKQTNYLNKASHPWPCKGILKMPTPIQPAWPIKCAPIKWGSWIKANMWILFPRAMLIKKSENSKASKAWEWCDHQLISSSLQPFTIQIIATNNFQRWSQAESQPFQNQDSPKTNSSNSHWGLRLPPIQDPQRPRHLKVYHPTTQDWGVCKEIATLKRVAKGWISPLMMEVRCSKSLNGTKRMIKSSWNSPEPQGAHGRK